MTVQDRRSVIKGVVAAVAATALFTQVSRRATASESPPENHEVEISSFKFSPETLKVRAGDTITWINKDIAPHTATARDKSWSTRRLNHNEKGSVLVTEDFASRYTCKFHPVMKGQLDIVVGN